MTGSDRSGKLRHMNFIKQIREARGLKQQRLAELLHTTEASISRYENQDQRLTLPLLRRIAAALKCSISEIAGEKEVSAEELRLTASFRALSTDRKRFVLDMVEGAARPPAESVPPLPTGTRKRRAS